MDAEVAAAVDGKVQTEEPEEPASGRFDTVAGNWDKFLAGQREEIKRADLATLAEIDYALGQPNTIPPAIVGAMKAAIKARKAELDRPGPMGAK